MLLVQVDRDRLEVRRRDPRLPEGGQDSFGEQAARGDGAAWYRVLGKNDETDSRHVGKSRSDARRLDGDSRLVAHRADYDERLLERTRSRPFGAVGKTRLVGPQLLDPPPGPPDHFLERLERAHVHDHEVRQGDPRGPVSLIGDSRLGVKTVHLAQFHQALDGDVDRGVDDEHSRKSVLGDIASLDEEREVDHDDIITGSQRREPG